VLLTTMDFATFVGLPMPDTLVNLRRWHGDVAARSSATA
jgi:hypothetical protein